MSENSRLFAKNPDADFTRKRKLDFENLIRFLVSKEGGTTGHELLKYFGYANNTISNSAFHQQRGKLSPKAMPHLLRQFNSHFPPTLYKNTYRLVACDGSEFNIARNPDDPDTFHPPSGCSSRGFNMIHTISLYDLLSKRYLDCVIQPGRKKNEFRAICDIVDRYPTEDNPIFIADRGFASYNFYAHVIKKGAYFLVRAKDINVKRLLKLEELPDRIDTNIEIILTRTSSKKKRKRPELAEQYRYITPEVSFDYIAPGTCDEFSLSLRVIRIEIEDGIFVNVITNLPPEKFGAEEIKYLYHLRWGIEISFRDLKHNIGAVNFNSKNVGFIEQEIWARLILFNFCAIITAHVVIAQKDTKHFHQVNFAMAVKICHHFIRLRKNEPPPDVEGLIGSYTLPIRLGRSFARQHRFQSPASFCYRFS